MDPVSAAILLGVNLAPSAVRGAVAAGQWIGARWRSFRGYPALPDGSDVMSVNAYSFADLAQDAPEVIAALPAGWDRWAGARPELRGAPSDTILAVPGLSNTDPSFRAALLDTAESLGVPVDSLASVISLETARTFDPKATNPPSGKFKGAYGLIQLTDGARLDGFRAGNGLEQVPSMSAVDQLQQIVIPYYQRLGIKVQGASPGRLYMANFLSAFIGASEDTILATQGDPKTGAIYAANHFDRAGKGYFTVGDVFETVAGIDRQAKGQRMAVDGTILPPVDQALDASAPSMSVAGPGCEFRDAPGAARMRVQGPGTKVPRPAGARGGARGVPGVPRRSPGAAPSAPISAGTAAQLVYAPPGVSAGPASSMPGALPISPAPPASSGPVATSIGPVAAVLPGAAPPGPPGVPPFGAPPPGAPWSSPAPGASAPPGWGGGWGAPGSGGQGAPAFSDPWAFGAPWAFGVSPAPPYACQMPVYLPEIGAWVCDPFDQPFTVAGPGCDFRDLHTVAAMAQQMVQGPGQPQMSDDLLRAYAEMRSRDWGIRDTAQTVDASVPWLNAGHPYWSSIPSERRVRLQTEIWGHAAPAPKGGAQMVQGPGDSARGILLAAAQNGTLDPIQWTEIEIPALDLAVQVPLDALRAEVNGQSLRLPASYAEQVQICQRLGCVSPTKEISDAVWQVADTKIQPVGLAQTGNEPIDSIGFVQRHNANLDAAIARAGAGPDALVRDLGKDWLIHPRMVERGAVNYGWRQPNGVPLQSVGGRHNADHSDYSQVVQNIVKRQARRISTGEAVDVIEWLRGQYPQLGSYLEAYG